MYRQMVWRIQWNLARQIIIEYAVKFAARPRRSHRLQLPSKVGNLVATRSQGLWI